MISVVTSLVSLAINSVTVHGSFHLSSKYLSRLLIETSKSRITLPSQV